MEVAVSERRKAFAAAHKSDENRQAYISASRRASSVIAKAKAEAWQATCSSLLPESNPKSVYFSFVPSPNFPNCSCCCCLPDSFRGIGGTVEDHGAPQARTRSRKKTENRQRVAKKVHSWTVQNEMRGVLGRVSADAAKRILDSANPREIRT